VVEVAVEEAEEVDAVVVAVAVASMPFLTCTPISG